MFDNNNNNVIPATCSSSSSETTDDISLFLRQILLKSSTSHSSPAFNITSSSTNTSSSNQTQCQIPQQQQSVYPSGLPHPIRIPTFTSPANTTPYLSSSSVGTVDNDDLVDEYDCESEDLMEEMVVKSNTSRNPSKRTRAAEVHNMSEKRRRSRINEKMKALQKLIPNSNKTDKASMLDEAIEYLKQLQLRVQMLTMRNGMNLYSMSVPPGVVQPPQLPDLQNALNERNELVNMVSLNRERHSNSMLNLPVPCTNHSQQLVTDYSQILNAGHSSTFRECLINSNGPEGTRLMNSQQERTNRHCKKKSPERNPLLWDTLNGKMKKVPFNSPCNPSDAV
ncbi:uncharacterized protein [Rutidosis leptorrhynchoides]|uniref:uncharacterized protein n=1 Tax=Rutidosis leptorrhynchoides TaxID=125765 RepID=UPI003A99424C